MEFGIPATSAFVQSSANHLNHSSSFNLVSNAIFVIIGICKSALIKRKGPVQSVTF